MQVCVGVWLVCLVGAWIALSGIGSLSLSSVIFPFSSCVKLVDLLFSLSQILTFLFLPCLNLASFLLGLVLFSLTLAFFLAPFL